MRFLFVAPTLFTVVFTAVATAQSPAPAPVSAPVAVTAGPVVLEVDASKVTAQVSPTLYGLMTEEINYSYDGGLYAELVRNRTFQDDENATPHWTLVQDQSAEGAMSLDRGNPLNAALPVSLKLEAKSLGNRGRVGVANDGFWGIPVKPETLYRASFYAKVSSDSPEAVTVSLESNDGSKVAASARVTDLSTEWKKYTVELKTGKVEASAQNRLVLSLSKPGTVWLDLVSLFPPTWNNRPNGNRKDIMQLLSDMKPSFLRFPGGNYLQGRTLATRFDWKKTLGDLSERPGHLNDSWRYRSSDGMGLLEFLLWCEDLKMEPVIGVFAGFTLRGVPTPVGKELEPFVQEVLEEIEYVTGDVHTPWGARRAKDGHPAPFKLHYVEIGNEDFFDRNPGTYEGRFAQFHDAIKARYPEIQTIATMKVSSRSPDVLDEHYYPRAAQIFEADSTRYDSYDRKGPKIFVGEWATRIGTPTPNFAAALGDAAWMIGMERNSDIVVMHAYAPLFVNVSDLTPEKGSMQWGTDLIGYNALTSYGSPSYYAQKMFSVNHGDAVVAAVASNVPTEEWQPPTPRSSTTVPPKKQVPTFFQVTTRDSSTGKLFLKLVNVAAHPQPVQLELKGAGSLRREGVAITLSAPNLTDTNSITDPTKIIPVTSKLAGVSSKFSRELPPYSISVWIIEGAK